MEADFWISKWNEDKIGFHQDKVNPALTSLFGNMDLAGKTVFVPLCGKSLDLIWLESRGLKVVGCELSKKAVESFYEENSIESSIVEANNGQVLYQGGGIQIYQGDFFDLVPPLKFDFIYDRAALIALPPETRRKYSSHLRRFLGKNALMLLICIQYDQNHMSGPPFSVRQEEVFDLYQGLRIKEAIGEGPEEKKFKDTTLMVEQKVYEIRS